jgi:hypothetical protein
MSTARFLAAVALVIVPLVGHEYYARYQCWERIRELEPSVRSAAVAGKTRSAVEADLAALGVKHEYSVETHAIYGSTVVGRFMFCYRTEYSFVIHLNPNDAVASMDSNVFHEGL